MPGDLKSLYRARLAREKGPVVKDWGGRFPVALAFPNTYGLGMSNLGFLTVYHLLNRRPEIVAERVFLPEGREMSLYLHSGRPLMSLESRRPLGDFQAIAFALSFENDYPHVLEMLRMGRIPLQSAQRSDDDPLVMAGGVAAFLNPEPLALFIDLFLLGEAEANLDDFVDALVSEWPSGLGRSYRLRALSGAADGVYIPSLYTPQYDAEGRLKAFRPLDSGVPQKVRVPRVPRLPDSLPPAGPLSPDSEFGERVLIELGRGCGRSCRFCAAGYVYRPPRFRTPETLCRFVDQALDHTGRVGLLSPAVSDVPGIEKVTARVVERGGEFSISSLRADSLTPGLVNDLFRAGQRTLAIAPEAGSERLRRVINKHLTEAQILEGVRRIAATAPMSLRLYFLVGLPTETASDVAAIATLVKRIRHRLIKESAPRGRIGSIRLSVNCFVPKPFTPFQWFPLEHVDSLKQKQRQLKRALAQVGGVKVITDVPRWAYVQALLSLGDRRVAGLLLKSHQLHGDWKRALRDSEVNPDFFVYRPKDLDEILPWDFLDYGLHKAYLRQEYRLALEDRESETCIPDQCERCGMCAALRALPGTSPPETS